MGVYCYLSNLPGELALNKGWSPGWTLLLGKGAFDVTFRNIPDSACMREAMEQMLRRCAFQAGGASHGHIFRRT